MSGCSAINASIFRRVRKIVIMRNLYVKLCSSAHNVRSAWLRDQPCAGHENDIDAFRGESLGAGMTDPSRCPR